MERSSSKAIQSQYPLSIRELIWTMFRHWKAVVVTACIMAILFSALQMVRHDKAMKAEKMNQDNLLSLQAEEIMSSLDSGEQITVNRLLRLRNIKKEAEEYTKNSVLMNVNAYDLTLAEINCTEEDEQERGSSFERLQSKLGSEEISSYIAGELGEEYSAWQVSELLLFKDKDSEDALDGEQNLTVSMVVPDDVDGEHALSVLEKAANKVIKDEGLRISLAGKVIKQTSDYRVVSRQNDTMGRMSTTDAQITGLRSTLSPKQISVYESLAASEDLKNSIETETDSENTKTGFSKKDAAVGFVGGILLYVIIYVAYILLRGKVQNSEVFEIAGISIIGEWNLVDEKSQGIKGSLFNDKKVFALQHKKHLNTENEMLNTKKTLTHMCEERDYSKLLLVELSESEESTANMLTKLTEQLKENGIESNICGMDDFRDTMDLSAYDAIVLVVNGNETRKDDVGDILAKVSNYGKEILGGISVSCC